MDFAVIRRQRLANSIDISGHAKLPGLITLTLSRQFCKIKEKYTEVMLPPVQTRLKLGLALG
jgi:hypothetical protein